MIKRLELLELKTLVIDYILNKKDETRMVL